MAQSYVSIQKQIAALQAEAERVRSTEKAGVIAKMKEAIRVYAIEPNELFGGSPQKRRSKVAVSKARPGAKYADGMGNEWSGRGPRPQWLRAALDSGKSIEDFAVGRAASAVKSTRAASGVKRRKKKLPVKFKDDAGNRWTGRGSQPRWLRDALAAGKKLDDFRV